MPGPCYEPDIASGFQIIGEETVGA